MSEEEKKSCQSCGMHCPAGAGAGLTLGIGIIFSLIYRK
jgi:hypothetical protein